MPSPDDVETTNLADNDDDYCAGEGFDIGQSSAEDQFLQIQTMVQELADILEEKRTRLEPMMKALASEKTTQAELAAKLKDTQASYEKSNPVLVKERAKLIKDVNILRQEAFASESAYHQLTHKCDLLDVLQEQLATELQVYVENADCAAIDPNAPRKPTMREAFNNKIREQGSIERSLNNRLAEIEETHDLNMQQLRI
eukprot:Clim_evm50s218 gene=Clim_evmTU50s218